MSLTSSVCTEEKKEFENSLVGFTKLIVFARVKSTRILANLRVRACQSS